MGSRPLSRSSRSDFSLQPRRRSCQAFSRLLNRTCWPRASIGIGLLELQIRMETLDKCFSCDTIEEIGNALENEGSKTDHAWCVSTLKRLKEVSHFSLKVSLRSKLNKVLTWTYLLSN